MSFTDALYRAPHQHGRVARLVSAPDRRHGFRLPGHNRPGSLLHHDLRRHMAAEPVDAPTGGHEGVRKIDHDPRRFAQGAAGLVGAGARCLDTSGMQPIRLPGRLLSTALTLVQECFGQAQPLPVAHRIAGASCGAFTRFLPVPPLARKVEFGAAQPLFGNVALVLNGLLVERVIASIATDFV